MGDLSRSRRITWKASLCMHSPPRREHRLIHRPLVYTHGAFMNRRQFLASAAVAGSMPMDRQQSRADQKSEGRTFATPEAASKSPPEQLGYVLGVYADTDIKRPDYLATIDLN